MQFQDAATQYGTKNLSPRSLQRRRWRLNAGQIRKFLPMILLAAIVCSAALPGRAEAARRAAIVIDGNSGRVLHATNPDLLCYPASLTKMMTLFLVFDDLKSGKLKFNTRVRVSKKAASATPSKLGLKAGSTISVRNAIKALITKSANDVAIAVAEHISGSEAAFARRMTRRAHQLGMRKTKFTNASGLPDTDQVTTARDITRLALALMDVHGKHYHLFAMRSFRFKGRTYKNHNGLLRNFRGTDGLKTGYTRASGFNLVASTRRDGKHVIGAVFGGKSVTERNRTMRWILTKSFKKASTTKTRKPIGVYRPQLIARAKPARRKLRRARLWPTPRPRLLRRGQLAKQVAPPATRVLRQPTIKISRVRPVRFTNPTTNRNTQAARLPRPSAHRMRTASRRRAPPGARLARRTRPPKQLARLPSTLNAQATKLANNRQMASLTPRFAPRSTARNRGYAVQNHAAGGVAKFGAPRTMRSALLATPASRQPQQRRAKPNQRRRLDSATRGNFQVQIGAYGTISEAQNRIRNVQAMAGNLLSGYTSVTMPFDKANKRYYRARFAGFNNSMAASTCNELRRRAVECFVTRAN